MKALSPYPSAYCRQKLTRPAQLPRWPLLDLTALAGLAPAVVLGAALALLAILAVEPGSSRFDQTAAAWLGQAGLLLIAAAWQAERLSRMLQLTLMGVAVAILAVVGLSQPAVLPLTALLTAIGGGLAVRATDHRPLFVGWLVFHAMAALVLALT